MKKLPKQRGLVRVPVPVHGNAAHNSAFLVSIGGLVVAWANNESVFLAMLQVLITGDRLTAAIVWHSHRTTLARLELVNRLCRERVSDKTLVEDIVSAIARFKGFSRTRNFYCHAQYGYGSDLCLEKATGATTPQEDEPTHSGGDESPEAPPSPLRE